MDNIDGGFKSYCEMMSVDWLLRELDKRSNDENLGITESVFCHRAKMKIRKMMADRYSKIYGK